MVKAYLKTEYWGASRILKIKFNGGEQVKIWGDPAKAVAFQLIFSSAKVNRWTNDGLELEVSEDVYEALKILSRACLTWRSASALGILTNPTPRQVSTSIAIKALLNKAAKRRSL